jgi:hypothetical protein
MSESKAWTENPKEGIVELPVWAMFYLNPRPDSACVEVWRRVKSADGGKVVAEFVGLGALGTDPPAKS